MAAARPFVSAEAMADAAERIAESLERADWLEAFAAHPRIGEREAASRWSAQEQAGVTDESRERFRELNRAYEARFGFIFIVCASGKRADEMLEILERRMRNNPQDELAEAARQQRQITQLRLLKLVDH